MFLWETDKRNGCRFLNTFLDVIILRTWVIIRGPYWKQSNIFKTFVLFSSLTSKCYILVKHFNCHVVSHKNGYINECFFNFVLLLTSWHHNWFQFRFNREYKKKIYKNNIRSRSSSQLNMGTNYTYRSSPVSSCCGSSQGRSSPDVDFDGEPIGEPPQMPLSPG